MVEYYSEAVLSFPRDCITGCDRFIPWDMANELLRSVEENMTWMPRHMAENADELIQPIPCALVLGEREKYRVFRRIDEGRSDLRARISLVVGGHIDYSAEESILSRLIIETLRREIAEELGTASPPEIKPVGLVIDFSSIQSSRHLGVVHEVMIKRKIKPVAKEEFSSRSKYIGQLYSRDELSMFRKEFDPWSGILFGDYISPSYSFDLGQQVRFLY